jgi:hypothetical protein
MGIALLCYVLYALIILIWCSLRGSSDDYCLISPDLLEQWCSTRSDLIVFEMHPDSRDRSPEPAGANMLATTPSRLRSIVDWIPPGSTLVFCNRGISSRSAQKMHQFLIVHNFSHIYWLDEAAHGVAASRSGGKSAW